jgi:hypothetical protein
MSKRIIRSISIMIIGVIMMLVGIFGLFDLKPKMVMTDNEIILRAKELGMIELKELLMDSND